MGEILKAIIITALAAAAIPSIAAAQTTPATETQYVAVADVLNRLKCDIYNAVKIAQDKEQRDFTITGEVSFSAEVVDGLSGTIGVTVEPPVLAEATVEGSKGKESTRGYTMTLGFDAAKLPNAPAGCVSAKVKTKGGAEANVPWTQAPLFTYTPLSTMQVDPGGATIAIRSVTYAGEFKVERSGGASGGLTLVVFKVGAESTQTKTNGQSYSVTLTFKEQSGGRVIFKSNN